MLTANDARRDAGRRRAQPSQQQRYHEYVLQRIEQYKNSVSREELMRLADQATAEMYDGEADQFVLGELLAAEMVDAAIRKRLRLKGFKSWRQTFAKRRAAQQQPTHWGLDHTCPLVGLLGRIEPGDRALLIGRGTEACAYLLAAHDADITFWHHEWGVVERVERKITEECLTLQFFSVCRPLDGSVASAGAPYDILVLDVGALAEIDARYHGEVLEVLQSLVPAGGVHVLLPSRTLVPEAVYSFYGGWEREAPAGPRRAQKVRGAVLVKPAPTEIRAAEPA